jgi:hypothetical protein
VAAVLATLKHTPQLQKQAYRRARRHWVRAFKQLRARCDQLTSMCATGEALPSRWAGYLPCWEQICQVRDRLPMGSIERVLLELHTHAIGRSREYAAVRIFDAAPSKVHRRAHPNHIVLHPSDPARSYLRLGSYKTARHLGAYKVVLSPIHLARGHRGLPAPAAPLVSVRTTHRPWPPISAEHVQSLGTPTLPSNHIRHAYANMLDLSRMTHDELQAAARRMGHANSDSLGRLYVWGALKTADAAASASAA